VDGRERDENVEVEKNAQPKNRRENLKNGNFKL